MSLRENRFPATQMLSWRHFHTAQTYVQKNRIYAGGEYSVGHAEAGCPCIFRRGNINALLLRDWLILAKTVLRFAYSRINFASLFLFWIGLRQKKKKDDFISSILTTMKPISPLILVYNRCLLTQPLTCTHCWLMCFPLCCSKNLASSWNSHNWVNHLFQFKVKNASFLISGIGITHLIHKQLYNSRTLCAT